MFTAKRRNILLTGGILIGALVVTVLCVLWCCNERTAESLAELMQQETQRDDFDLSFNYNLGSPSPFTQLLKTDVYDPYTRIPGEAPSRVHIYTHGGELFASVSSPAEADLPAQLRVVPRVQQHKLIYRRHPDGLRHPLRHIQLTYELYYDRGSAPVAVIRQMLELDLMMRTVDFIPQDDEQVPPEYAGMTASMYQTPWRGELPAKIDADPVPASMLRIVYALAAIESQEQAEAAAGALVAFADQLVHFEPYPAAPWPGNWGDYATDAREAARLLTPSLVYLQEKECFHSAALASFINSSAFEIIFGTRFSEDTPANQGPFPVRRVADDSCSSCPR